MKASLRALTNPSPGNELARICPNLAHYLDWTTYSLVFVFFGAVHITAPLQAGSPEQKWQFPCREEEIAHYTAYPVRQLIKVDGRLDEECWYKVSRSPRFVDMITACERFRRMGLEPARRLGFAYSGVFPLY